jgi:2'-5' RNA ligase
MSDRCIFLQVDGPGRPALQVLRNRHDPLAAQVPPHLTLVFPFTLDWPVRRLAALLERQRADLPITFTLAPPVVDDDVLYFPVDRGRALVAALHDRLYEALPAELLADRPYRPHLTFGRTTPGTAVPEILAEAVPCATGTWTAGRLVLERITAGGASEVEHVVS